MSYRLKTLYLRCAATVAAMVCAIACCQPLAAQLSARSNEGLLTDLDEMLNQVPTYEQARKERISRLKQQAAGVRDAEQRYWIVKSIFDEYSFFDSDSAMVYGHQTADIARNLNRSDWQSDLHITTSYTLAAIGLLDESLDELSKVDVATLTPSQKVDYMGQQLYLLTHREQFANDPQGKIVFGNDAARLLDSIVAVVPTDHPEYYYYIAYQGLRSKESALKAIEAVEPYLATIAYDTREDAKLAWVVSQLYAKVGNEEMHQRFLTLSAMADLRIANREIASLEELSGIMDARGDLVRAYNYIGHCLKCAELYHNRVRALRIATLQSRISERYQQRLMELRRRSQLSLWVMGALLVILVGMLLYALVQRRRLAASNHHLAQANEESNANLRQLSEAYRRLAETNERLSVMTQQSQEADAREAATYALHIKSITSLVELWAEAVDDVDTQRRRINRLLKANQIESARDAAESTDFVQTCVKQFNQHFDAIFLSIFPTFVADFNALLSPDEHITPKGDGLNTDLRIYALVALGITDSVTIAKVLHCAVQTVYNKRMKIRSHAIVSREGFVDSVRRLVSEPSQQGRSV